MYPCHVNCSRWDGKVKQCWFLCIKSWIAQMAAAEQYLMCTNIFFFFLFWWLGFLTSLLCSFWTCKQFDQTTQTMSGISSIFGRENCESYLIFQGETGLGAGFRTFLYFLGLAYCFLGLSAITACFFRSMESVVSHSRKVVGIDPYTGAEVIRYEKVWNFTIADISLLAFGTSFPQISLATIDAIRNLGNLYAGGLFSKTCQVINRVADFEIFSSWFIF